MTCTSTLSTYPFILIQTFILIPTFFLILPLYQSNYIVAYPLGNLVAVGGAEDKGTDLEKGILQRNRLNFFELGILKNIVSLIGADGPCVEVITTASSIPDEV